MLNQLSIWLSQSVQVCSGTQCDGSARSSSASFHRFQNAALTFDSKSMSRHSLEATIHQRFRLMNIQAIDDEMPFSCGSLLTVCWMWLVKSASVRVWPQVGVTIDYFKVGNKVWVPWRFSNSRLRCTFPGLRVGLALGAKSAWIPVISSVHTVRSPCKARAAAVDKPGNVDFVLKLLVQRGGLTSNESGVVSTRQLQRNRPHVAPRCSRRLSFHLLS